MNAAKPPLLALEGVTKRFGGLRALAGVDLQVTAGESVALLGANGAGKSTLLRVVSGLARPTTGRVVIDGRPFLADPLAWRRRLGVVAHDTMLYDRLTVRENLCFAARLHDVRDLRSRVDQLLRALALDTRADDEVRTLSRGLEQRAVLARALVHDPEVLLLDEPWTGLDPTAAQVLTSLLGVLRRRQRTLLIVTHDLARALDACDRFIVLRGGRVALDERQGGGDDASLPARCLAALTGTPPAEESAA